MADAFTGTNSIPTDNGSVNLYKAKNVSITVTRADGSTVILKNFQDGDMFTATKTDNKVDGMSDPQGNGAAAVIYSGLGSGVVTFQQGSPSNNLFSQMYNSDEVFGFHGSFGQETVGANHCMLQKAPDVAYGKTIPTRAWTIVFLDHKYDGDVQ